MYISAITGPTNPPATKIKQPTKFYDFEKRTVEPNGDTIIIEEYGSPISIHRRIYESRPSEYVRVQTGWERYSFNDENGNLTYSGKAEFSKVGGYFSCEETEKYYDDEQRLSKSTKSTTIAFFGHYEKSKYTTAYDKNGRVANTVSMNTKRDFGDLSEKVSVKEIRYGEAVPYKQAVKEMNPQVATSSLELLQMTQPKKDVKVPFAP